MKKLSHQNKKILVKKRVSKLARTSSTRLISRRVLVKTKYDGVRTVDGIRKPKRKAFVMSYTHPVKTPWAKHLSVYSRSISLFALVMIFTFSFTMTQASSTLSYFSDIETSVGNIFGAGSLDFSVALADPESSNIKLTSGAQAVTIIPTVAPGAGDFPLAYKVHVEKTGGTNNAFCNAIDVSATSGAFNYTGKLLAFLEGTTTAVTPLSMSLSLPAGGGFTAADTCLVDVVYSGWVDGQTEGIQYSDVERVSLQIVDPPAPQSSTESVDTPSADTAPSVEAEQATTTEASTTDETPVIDSSDDTTAPDAIPPVDTISEVSSTPDSTTTPEADTVAPPVETPPTESAITPPSTDIPVDTVE